MAGPAERGTTSVLTFTTTLPDCVLIYDSLNQIEIGRRDSFDLDNEKGAPESVYLRRTKE